MEQTPNLHDAMQHALRIVTEYRSEYLCPEHFLLGLLDQQAFRNAFVHECDGDHHLLTHVLKDYLSQMDHIATDSDTYEPEASFQFHEMVNIAYAYAGRRAVDKLDVYHLVNAMFQLEDSCASQALRESLPCSQGEFIAALISSYEQDDPDDLELEDMQDEDEDDHAPWRQFVVNMTERVGDRHPLIGREAEMERTIQVLCRKDKKNPMHVGESGVGKTALAWGLAARIKSGDVPARLQGSNMYEVDLGSMVAGSQYRGDFEKRVKFLMEGIAGSGPSIVYIDDIHNLVGTGSIGDSAMDAFQLLRPYMDVPHIHFVGSTTYQDLNRHIAGNRSMMRRFQQIDIPEPSAAETVQILKGLQSNYEEYHGLKYADGVMEYAVEVSQRHISDRFLPDKAIDLIDEAAASVVMRKGRKVKKQDIDQVLTKVCKINADVLKDESSKNLKTLGKRMKQQIYGQDEAIMHVVSSVEMAKAGLLDEQKPMAALLFVGPTGVGKTEVAKVLAHELGIQLVRFDMSEYTEKHTVAKLIGSPAGYIGYEDGGLLTDAIRKNPNCVLLLDEIEKAHTDIYNILLQVMDYARLTDNRGNKADFRNVILIMTSNAGAQYASQASVGFGGGISAGEAMLAQVRKTFKPEFLNRLSGTVVFHDMDRTMATLILDKKLRQLQAKLSARQVNLKLSPEARDYILQQGFTRQYGAREMDRVIQQQLSVLLMREILYGKLQKGGTAHVVLSDGQLSINV